MNLIFFFPAAITFFLHPSPPPGENLFRARLSAPFCRQQFAVKGLNKSAALSSRQKTIADPGVNPDFFGHF
jgi:hypothetical protein